MLQKLDYTGFQKNGGVSKNAGIHSIRDVMNNDQAETEYSAAE